MSAAVSYDRSNILERDVYRFSIRHNDGLVRFVEVGGQAFMTWIRAHRTEVEAFPQGDRMPLEMVLRICADVGDEMEAMEPARKPMTTLRLAKELWWADPEVYAFLLDKMEHRFWSRRQQLRGRAIAWRRDELGKREFYIGMASTVVSSWGAVYR